MVIQNETTKSQKQLGRKSQNKQPHTKENMFSHFCDKQTDAV